MKNLLLGSMLVTGLLFVGSCEEKKEKSFVEKFDNFETQLIRKSKSFQNYEPFDSIRGTIEMVSYYSDSLKLKGLINNENIHPDKKNPVLVFLHGGFALSYGQLEVLKAFTDAGYIVFAPSLRSENGNPGNFELFFGEVKDAKAAIRWISNQPYVDPDKIYVFGWSVGGGLALNLSFHDDIPIKFSGSSAGIYDHDLIKSWATEDDMIVFPYNYQDSTENYFRLPIYSLKNMVRPHITYIGEDDDYDYTRKFIDSLYPSENIDLKLVKVDGNHMTSLPVAIEMFLEEINN